MIIAIDAMGGDFGPKETIPGALLAIKDGIEAITLVGQKKEIQKELKKHQASDNPHISIVNATETVEMSESPTQSFKSKKDSSIRVGLELVKNKKADAFISCGNTGAVMFASIMTLGRMKGVERPAISGIIPTEKGPMVLLDLGSNVDCKPEHLFQFGIMGHYFAEHILHIKTPKIGLLNIGEEKDKGNNLTLNTYSKLEEADINFIGNIEGKELLSGKANVVVCDGFTGNTVLKFGEGIAKLFTNFFRISFLSHNCCSSLYTQFLLYCPSSLACSTIFFSICRSTLNSSNFASLCVM